MTTMPAALPAKYHPDHIPCPTCDAEGRLAAVDRPGSPYDRYVVCGRCDGRGHVDRADCNGCGDEIPVRLIALTTVSRRDRSLHYCDECAPAEVPFWVRGVRPEAA